MLSDQQNQQAPMYIASTDRLGRRAQDWFWPIGLGSIMMVMGWGMSTTSAAPPKANLGSAIHYSHVSSLLQRQHHSVENTLSTGQSTSINTNNHILVYKCHGGKLVIKGNNDAITTQGYCDSFTISGIHDKIRVYGKSDSGINQDTEDTVIMGGNHNTATLPRAANIEIDNNGISNTITVSEP